MSADIDATRAAVIAHTLMITMAEAQGYEKKWNVGDKAGILLRLSRTTHDTGFRERVITLTNLPKPGWTGLSTHPAHPGKGWKNKQSWTSTGWERLDGHQSVNDLEKFAARNEKPKVRSLHLRHYNGVPSGIFQEP